MVSGIAWFVLPAFLTFPSFHFSPFPSKWLVHLDAPSWQGARTWAVIFGQKPAVALFPPIRHLGGGREGPPALKLVHTHAQQSSRNLKSLSVPYLIVFNSNWTVSIHCREAPQALKISRALRCKTPDREKPWCSISFTFQHQFCNLKCEPVSSPKLPSKRKWGGTVERCWPYLQCGVIETLLRVEVAIQDWPDERERLVQCTLRWDARMTKERWREGGCRNDSSTLPGKCSLYPQARVVKETKAKESVLRNWWTCGWEHHRPTERGLLQCSSCNTLAWASQAVFILMLQLILNW